MIQCAGVILVTKDGGVLLQRRDDVDGVVDRGMLSIFAGANLEGETSIQAALRELEEETDLRLVPEAIYFFDRFQFKQNLSDIFIARNIKVDDITILEGTGVELISSRSDFLSHKDIAPISRLALDTFFNFVRFGKPVIDASSKVH